MREIGARFRMTPRAAFDHLRALERKGALQRRESAGRTSRALTVVRSAPQAGESRRVPILGRIAAGAPLLAEEHRDGTLPILPRGLAGPSRGLLRAARPGRQHDRGPHLRRRPRRRAPAGCGRSRTTSSWPCWETGPKPEATVKRFVRDGSRVILKPENPAMGPIVVDPALASPHDPRQGDRSRQGLLEQFRKEGHSCKQERHDTHLSAIAYSAGVSGVAHRQ